MILTLQMGSISGCDGTLPETTVVTAEVVRTSPEGMGLKFRLLDLADRRSLAAFLAKRKPGPAAAIGKPVSQRRLVQGQALVEYMLVMPLLFLLIVNMINFGGFIFAWITVANAARAGAQYAVLNSGSVGGLTAATGTQVNALITQDISSLVHRSSLAVNICQNNNGTVTAVTGTCSGIAADPEPTTFILVSVDVTYTYNPLIALFNFPQLGIHATLPSSTIHRRTYMRVIK